ncbi:MAG: alginate export family protein [Flavobacterium sp.]
MNPLKKITLFALLSISSAGFAQEFDIDLQLRPRFEFRNGFKSPLLNSEDPTSFISQRSRLNLTFKQDKLTTKLSVQDIRTWGDAATTATAGKNGLAVFEAWAAYNFDAHWSTKLGRQVLSYDNERIMGGIDWLQQGQSHDAALITYKKGKSHLDLGFALNANAENLVEPKAPYTTNYKSMQYAWFHNNWSKINMSILFLNTGYEFQKNLTDLEVDYKQTFGTYLTYKENKWDANVGLYGQTGQSAGKKLGAWYAAAAVNYAFVDGFTAGVGYEFLSGKDQNDKDSKLKSFTPLFGTNHAFNGLMDYFYVGNHQNNVGLQDAYLKFNYKNKKWQFTLVPHLFNAPGKVFDAQGKEMDSYLGTEIDFTTSYALQKDIILSGGFSQIFTSSTLERVKNVTNAASANNWAWVMVSFSPKLLSVSKK